LTGAGIVSWKSKAASILTLALLSLAWPVSCPAGEGDSLLAIVPLDEITAGTEFDPYEGIIVSETAMLVMVPAPLAGRLQATDGVRLLDRRPQRPLWIVQGEVPDRLASALGITVLFRTAGGTVFEAHRDAAYMLFDHGYFVVELDLMPVADLKEPPPGTGLVEHLLGRRPLTAGRTNLIRLASEAVDTAGLEAAMRWLSYDTDAGEYRSRFAPRAEVEEDVVPYLQDLLASYVEPDGGWVRLDEFEVKLGGNYQGGDSTFVNVIGVVPGTGTSAYYIICAHYDAIGIRSSTWDWRTDPAPGVDDNGTGVAAVLECARILSDLNLDVGVVYALFSGEELGLHGSKSYVSSYAETDTILGVINFDMMGYVQGGKQIEVWDDWKSEWLYSMLNEVSDSIGPDVALVQRFMPGIHNSDHASFWTVGIPGIMLADRTSNGIPVYPYYHTTADTMGNIEIGQVWDATRLVVAAMARFSTAEDESLPDIELTAGSIEWDWEGRDRRDLPLAGDSLMAIVRPINIGASMEAPQPYRLEVWRGGPNRGRLVYRSTPDISTLSGEFARLEAGWEIESDLSGYVVYTFVLMPQGSGVESDTTNNSAENRVLVMSSGVLVGDFHVQPNPVTDVSEAQLSFVITHPESDFDGTMKVRIFDLLGTQIGYGLLRKTPTALDIDIGENLIHLSEFLSPAADLAPGIYVCVAELSLVGEAGRASARFRFAVAR
jgi:hypothetical protein